MVDVLYKKILPNLFQINNETYINKHNKIIVTENLSL
jgi:hypothetical protein